MDMDLKAAVTHRPSDEAIYDHTEPDPVAEIMEVLDRIPTVTGQYNALLSSVVMWCESISDPSPFEACKVMGSSALHMIEERAGSREEGCL